MRVRRRFKLERDLPLLAKRVGGAELIAVTRETGIGAGDETDPVASAALAAHEGDTTNVHGLSDTAKLAAIIALTWANDKLIYLTGSGSAAVTDFTSTARQLLDDSSFSAMRTSLGLVIGADVQAYSGNLAALAGLTSANNKGIYWTGSGTAATFDLSAFARTFLDDADATAVRATLGLIIGTDVAAQADARFPTADQKAALVGTAGTPAAGNPYVTDEDVRLDFAPSLLLIPKILGLVPSLYWGLDGTNLATDLSNNGRNGTGAGSITIGGVPGLYGVNGATDFDGTNDKLTSTYQPFVNATARTFMGWAFLDSGTTGDRILFGKSFSDNNSLRVNASNFNTRLIADISTVDITWAAAWPGFDRWVHWALVYDESTDVASLYINGTLASSVTDAGSWAANANLQLGSDDVNPWNGKMTHFAIFERALTAAEIRGIYEVGTRTQINPPSARVYNSAAISVPDTALTALTFNSERHDNDNLHSTSTNTGRLTASRAGVYEIAANVNFAGNATGVRLLNLRLNGSTGIATDSRAANGSATVAVSIGTQIKLAAGDYVEVVAFQTSGGSLDVQADGNFSPEFALTWLGEG